MFRGIMMMVFGALIVVGIALTVMAAPGDKPEKGEKAGKSAGGRAGHGQLAMMAYTLRNFTLLETIDKTKTLKLKYLEAFSWQKIGGTHGDAQFNPSASKEALKAVKDKLNDAGIKLVGYYSHKLGEDPAETTKVFEFCKDMGIEYIVCEPQAKDLDTVEKLADKYGVNIAIHNHPKDSKKPEYTNWDPAQVAKLFEKRGKRIGACADTGHWIRSGLDPVEGLKKYKGRIFALHLKDVKEAKPEAADVVWGTGKADLKAVLAELKTQKFAGYVSIEYEAHPDNNMDEVAQCIKFFRQTAKELGH